MLEPAVVRELAKISPSASTRNFTWSFTRSPRRFVSAMAEEGLMTRDDVVAEAAVVFTTQEEKV